MAAIARETLRQYELLRDDCALVRIDDSSLLELRGEDRKSWLQGQCTNDLRLLEPGGSIRFCICSATGHLLAPCTGWEDRDRLLIALPTSSVPAALERVETTVIMEDVTVRVLAAGGTWTSVQGPRSTLASFSKEVEGDLAAFQGGLGLRHDRFGVGGWDLLGAVPAAIPEAGAEAAEIVRIEAGRPRFGFDATMKTLPPELGPAFEAGYVSYGKGCYTGQEVLMRIHSRGHTNRRLVGLRAEDIIGAGAPVWHESRSAAGVVTSFAVSPRFGPIALATIRNEISLGEQVKIDSVSAQMVEIPFG